MTSLHHITVVTTDLAAACALYDAALGALGLVRLTELVDEEEDEAELEAVAWGPEGGDAIVWLVAGVRPTTGLHLAFATASHAEVETFYAAAMGQGGVAHSAPRRWTPYRRGEFTAIVEDGAGNLIEAVAPE